MKKNRLGPLCTCGLVTDAMIEVEPLCMIAPCSKQIRTFVYAASWTFALNCAMHNGSKSGLEPFYNRKLILSYYFFYLVPVLLHYRHRKCSYTISNQIHWLYTTYWCFCLYGYLWILSTFNNAVCNTLQTFVWPESTASLVTSVQSTTLTLKNFNSYSSAMHDSILLL